VEQLTRHQLILKNPKKKYSMNINDDILKLQHFFLSSGCRKVGVKITPVDGSQDVPRVFWNTKVPCRVYKSPLLDSFLSQMNPVPHPHPIFLFQYYPSIQTQASQMVTSIKVLRSRFYMHFSSLQCMLHVRPCNFLFYNYLMSTDYKFPHCAVLSVSCCFLPLTSKYSPQHLFSNSLKLCSFLGLKHQVSYPF
jgi:hypothetical protein